MEISGSNLHYILLSSKDNIFNLPMQTVRLC